MISLISSVVRRYLQADVVPFSPKPRAPTVTIAGKKYVLSTDGGPLGDREEDSDEDTSPLGGRLIRGPVGDKWRYLWVYDTDKKLVVMWRATDGNEKVYAPASSMMMKVAKLDKKGQLNRVSHDEFLKIDRVMNNLAKELEEALLRDVEDGKNEETKKLDSLVQKYFDANVRDQLEKSLDEVRRGVIPFGFKPSEEGEMTPTRKLRQALSFTFGRVIDRLFKIKNVIPFLEANGINTDEAGQWVNFAVEDAVMKAQEEFLA
jgi:hypothetical protein